MDDAGKREREKRWRRREKDGEGGGEREPGGGVVAEIEGGRTLKKEGHRDKGRRYG